MRSSPSFPLPSIICAKANRSSTVETRPPAPDSKAADSESAVLDRIEDLEFARREIRPIGCRQPVELARRDAEGRVLHAERREDPLLQELAQGHIRGAGDEHTEDVGPEL